VLLVATEGNAYSPYPHLDWPPFGVGIGVALMAFVVPALMPARVSRAGGGS
jgi:hypothetical protein